MKLELRSWNEWRIYLEIRIVFIVRFFVKTKFDLIEREREKYEIH